MIITPATPSPTATKVVQMMPPPPETSVIDQTMVPSFYSVQYSTPTGGGQGPTTQTSKGPGPAFEATAKETGPSVHDISGYDERNRTTAVTTWWLRPLRLRSMRKAWSTSSGLSEKP